MRTCINCVCRVVEGETECRACQENGAVDHSHTVTCQECDVEMCLDHLPGDCFEHRMCTVCLHGEMTEDDDCDSVMETEWMDYSADLGEDDEMVPVRPGPERILPEWMRPHKRIRVTTVVRHAREDEREQSCAVCLQTLGTKVACMPCGAQHAFHENCINEWLKGSDTCPMCRGGPSQL